MQFEQAATFGWGIPDFGEGEFEIAAEDVQIVVREKKQVAGLDGDDLASGRQARETRPVGQEMKEHDVIGVGQFGRGGVQPIARGHAPRRRELGIDVDRAIEADGREHVRQGVHDRSISRERGPVRPRLALYFTAWIAELECLGVEHAVDVAAPGPSKIGQQTIG